MSDRRRGTALIVLFGIYTGINNELVEYLLIKYKVIINN
jgi:hypothetical protein